VKREQQNNMKRATIKFYTPRSPGYAAGVLFSCFMLLHPRSYSIAAGVSRVCCSRGGLGYVQRCLGGALLL
jgi:hypothetical protein